MWDICRRKDSLSASDLFELVTQQQKSLVIRVSTHAAASSGAVAAAADGGQRRRWGDAARPLAAAVRNRPPA